MRLSRAQAGYEGRVTAPFQEGTVRLSVDDDRLSGTIEGGLFEGKLSGRRTSNQEPLRDYPAIWRNIESTLQANIYNRQALEHPEYIRFAELLAAASESAIDDMDLLLAFRLSWNNTAFSHFQLRRSSVSAESTVRSLDRLRVGYDAARVDFDGDMAWLTVDTMMGNDTIEQIEAAYREIDQAESKALVIDLRNNTGGAFAAKPLVEHVIDEPIDAGYFMGQKWSNRAAPDGDELAAIEPWTGWSIRAFWHTIRQEGLVRLRFTPAEPHFGGEVYVLVSQQTASAAELAVDALRSSARATIIGEQTAGEMLSQSMYDAGSGFQVSLPIADYVSSKHGRIEGVGVRADIEVQSANAAETARRLHSQAR